MAQGDNISMTRPSVSRINTYLPWGSTTSGQNIKIHKPGAMHNARFMSHSKYIQKMGHLSNLSERWSKFIALFFLQFFLRWTISIFARLLQNIFYNELVSRERFRYFNRSVFNN